MLIKKKQIKKNQNNKEIINNNNLINNDYKIIFSPIITEKSTTLFKNKHKVIFKVNKNSNKISIKKAFEKIFNIKVLKISILNTNSKKITRNGHKGEKSSFKKAIITIENNKNLDFLKE